MFDHGNRQKSIYHCVGGWNLNIIYPYNSQAVKTQLRKIASRLMNSHFLSANGDFDAFSVLNRFQCRIQRVNYESGKKHA